MKKKVYIFSYISMVLLTVGILLFSRFVDGHYELKNLLSVIGVVYICINLVIIYLFKLFLLSLGRLLLKSS